MKNLKVISTIVGMLMLTTAVNAQPAVKVKGGSSLNVLENAISIKITGQPAIKLLQALKLKVQKDKDAEIWGLTIYRSKDDLLVCDETNRKALYCEVWFNTKDVQIEPTLFTE